MLQTSHDRPQDRNEIFSTVVNGGRGSRRGDCRNHRSQVGPEIGWQKERLIESVAMSGFSPLVLLPCQEVKLYDIPRMEGRAPYENVTSPPRKKRAPAFFRPELPVISAAVLAESNRFRIGDDLNGFSKLPLQRLLDMPRDAAAVIAVETGNDNRQLVALGSRRPKPFPERGEQCSHKARKEHRQQKKGKSKDRGYELPLLGAKFRADVRTDIVDAGRSTRADEDAGKQILR
ncbi:MAG TPA: hypothetical protein VIM02_03355 [Rhizomicrobium sp.]